MEVRRRIDRCFYGTYKHVAWFGLFVMRVPSRLGGPIVRRFGGEEVFGSELAPGQVHR